MASVISKLVAKTRSERGSAAARRLRREGWLPGNINRESGEACAVLLKRHDFELMLRLHASERLLLDLEIDAAAPLKVLLKDVQHDPLSNNCVHADFVEVSMTKKMRVLVPLTLVGEAPGVTQGGVLEQLLRSVEIECLPTDLVEQIEVDVSSLELNQSLRVSDIKVSPTLAVLTPGNVGVVAVMVPKAEEEAKPEEAAAEAGAGEPEVIGEAKRKESEEADKAEKPEPAAAKKK